ncbi:hypothetical protein BGZ76_000148 [Entomortierella beljakovae]|nr:hypothetical protein BGZ76_000148 [Entomortierella beljakovae]
MERRRDEAKKSGNEISANMFKNMALRLHLEFQKNWGAAKSDEWTLSDVIRGAIGNKKLLDRKVKLRTKEVYKEKKKCLRLKTSVLKLSETILCEFDESIKPEEGIFLCKKNAANLDCRWILETDDGKPMAIFVQTKHSDLTTDGNKFNQAQLNGWYKEISHSTSKYEKDYDVVIALITNREYNNPSTMVRGRTDAYGINGMPNLLLIDKPRLKDFLSPTFAHRGLLAMELEETEPEETEPEESEPEETEPVDLDDPNKLASELP